MYYNTVTNCLMFYTGSAWQAIDCSCVTAPAKPGAITGPTSFCVNLTGNTYSIAAVPNALSYIWTVPASVGILTSGQGTTSITVTGAAIAGSGKISVQSYNGCGASAAKNTATITLNPTPNAPVISSTYSFTCPGQTGCTYSVPPIAGVTYLWSVSSTTVGAIVAGQGTTSITVTMASPGDSGTISCVESNTCGTGTPGTFAVSSTGHGTQTFTVTDAPQTWVVPSCVTTLTIVASGAAGGSSTEEAGGNGTVVTATVTVVSGNTLDLIVGDVGTTNNYSGGGGGGTYVYDNSSTNYPIVAAGGAGGGGFKSPGANGSTTLTPKASVGGCGAGGSNGNAGAEGALTAAGPGGGGAGWITVNGLPAAATASKGAGGVGEPSAFAGGAGASNTFPLSTGGYGGGGGGGYNANSTWGGGGGGGGYNGGGGGSAASGTKQYGGGGAGSGYYNAGYPYTTAADFVPPVTAVATNTGTGSITITW
jgi:PKD-like domain